MFARMATFEGGDPARADEIVEAVRGMIRSRAQEMPGAQRFMLLLDREAGIARAVTLFESEQAMRDAEPIFEQMTPALPDASGVRRSVEQLEVAIDEQLG